MYYLVTDSRYNGSGPNLAIVEATPAGILHHDWSYSLLDSYYGPTPQPSANSLEQLISNPAYYADTVLCSFSNLDELALIHPEFFI